MLIPGTNGGKMSKSAANINIFLDDLGHGSNNDKPKTQNPTSAIFLARHENKLLGGNMSRHAAKQALYELICETFKTEREKYNYYMNNLPEVDAFENWCWKAWLLPMESSKVREKLGFETPEYL
jgi:tryptophanyl-tRNA synthetase